MDLLPNPKDQGKPHVICPTGDCEFPSQWSLGACKSCREEVLDARAAKCEYSAPYSPDDQRRFDSSVPPPVWDLLGFKSAVHMNGSRLYREAWATCLYSVTLTVHTELGEELLSWQSALLQGEVRFRLSHPFDFGQYGRWGELSGLKRANKFNSSEIFSVSHHRLESGFPDIEEVADWEGPKIRRRTCEISFCAKHYSNTSVSHGNITRYQDSINLVFNRACDGKDCHYSNAKTNFEDGPTFYLDTESRLKFSDALVEVVIGVLQMVLAQKYVAKLTLEGFSEMLCTVVDSFLKSEHNQNSTAVRGLTLGKETYVHVRWQWAVFPLSIIIASAVFLALTVLESRHKEQRYKSSVLAGCFHKLVGIDDDEWRRIERQVLDQKSRKETFHNLETMAREVRVKLRRNSEGDMELMKI